jgi:hypothetical protein
VEQEVLRATSTRRVLRLLKLYVAKAKEWFIKELEVREQYKVSFIDKFKGQKVMYRTKPKGLGVRYFT